MQCHDFQEMVDSYLSNELLVETNHEILRHLEECPDCRSYLADLRKLRSRIKVAFVNAEQHRIPIETADRISDNLRTKTQSHVKKTIVVRPVLWAVAASFLVATGFGLNLILGSTPKPPPDVFSINRFTLTQSAGISNVVTSLHLISARVHRDCAIDHNVDGWPIDLNRAGQKYDPAYVDLAQVVMTKHDAFSSDLKLVMAHACVFEGQRFAHVVIESQGRLISVVVSDQNYQNNAKVNTTQMNENPEHYLNAFSSSSGHQICSFITTHHIVFVISDYSTAENLRVTSLLAPSIYKHLVRKENAT